MKSVFPTVKISFYRETFDGWVIPKRTIPDYELVFITEGYGYTIINERKYELKKGMLVYYTPNETNQLWIEKEPYMKFYFVHFYTDEALKIPEITNVPFDIFHNLFKKLYRSYRNKDAYSIWNSTLILSEIILNIYKHLNNDSPSTLLRIQKSVEYMKHNFSRNISLEELCNNVGMKKSNFCRVFREGTGKTPIEYLQHMRIDHSQEMLINTDTRISDIAHLCGFDDEFYFSRVFKQICGMSPSDFRKMI